MKLLENLQWLSEYASKADDPDHMRTGNTTLWLIDPKGRKIKFGKVEHDEPKVYEAKWLAAQDSPTTVHGMLNGEAHDSPEAKEAGIGGMVMRYVTKGGDYPEGGLFFYSPTNFITVPGTVNTQGLARHEFHDRAALEQVFGTPLPDAVEPWAQILDSPNGSEEHQENHP